ncbi:sporulation integral membrane protein YtvI [Insulibacter thermoxylanivorax]|uniref:Sporulation integral membrane protein YtvI n=1 Tax=Insulibacter thermoxylanivorax TaxID=2749268 RepID=A0A916QDC5_9BACL|nr:sporulation integral membrane protein YtvI [Insulibacter thermoxylanivorax]GFR38651.1 sporulation integral membrane protein YtvI [Insulibacter thermoxylanivorax]
MTKKTLFIIVFGLGFLYALFTVGFPFLLALVVVLFMEPFTKLIMKVGKLGRTAAATISSSIFTIGLLGLAYLIGVKLLSELMSFFNYAKNNFHHVADFFDRLTYDANILFDTLPPDQAASLAETFDAGMDALISAAQSLLSNLSSYALNFAKAIPDLFLFFLFFIVAVFLFNISLGKMKQGFLSIFDESSQGKVDVVLGNLRNSIFGFVRAQIVFSGMTYVLTLIGLLILGIDHAFAIAFLVTIVDLLPVLGVGSFLVPWAIYQALIGNWFIAIGLVVLFIVITVVRRVIEPKVLGDAVGISALAALISLYVGFKLVGVIGLFLGPVVVLVYEAMRKEGLLNIKIKLE